MKYTNKKRKKRGSFGYYKYLSFFILFFLLFFLFNSYINNYIYNKNMTSYFIETLFKPITYFDKIINSKNNKKLEKELISQKLINSNHNTNILEFEELKKLNNIKGYTDYKKIYSKVIYRNKMYWFNTFTIDKGKKDGIKNNSVVLSKDGMIGVIKNTGYKTSSVELITSNSNNYKISVQISSESKITYGEIYKYKKPYLEIELISSNNNIKKGDLVMTSGLDNHPRGIEIGKVESIKKDSYDLTSILDINLSSDIDSTFYVVVLVK